MQNNLATYAVTETNSRGRKIPQQPHKYRTDFDRDRDRIIHSQAFRRLEGKTQVFTPGLDDNYRNRLTHSIEVAQIGRTIAKNLNVNETLTEAICLAHDLGHPPFGHSGEKFLDRLMKDFGGFEHNKQTLRIVDFLERPYSAFSGLNLMYETRLGLAKHRSPYDVPGQTDFTQLSCSLEGQIADISDRIAYNCHDLEDGLLSGLLNDKDLEKIAIVNEAKNKINSEPIEDKNTLRTRIAKSIIDILVSSCIETSLQKIKALSIKTVDDLYNRKEYIVSISDDYEAKLIELEKFLHKNMYYNPKLVDSLKQVDLRLERLFEKYRKNTSLMPVSYQKLIAVQGIERTVCDYIAGMTDRFCLKMVDNG